MSLIKQFHEGSFIKQITLHGFDNQIQNYNQLLNNTSGKATFSSHLRNKSTAIQSINEQTGNPQIQITVEYPAEEQIPPISSFYIENGQIKSVTM